MWRWCMAAGRSSDRLPWILIFIAIYQEIPRAYTKQALIFLCQKRLRRRPVQPSPVNQSVIQLFLILRRLHTHESTLFYPQDVVISTKVLHNHLFQMRFYLGIVCTPGHGNLFPVVGLCLHLHFPHSKGIILPVSDEAFRVTNDVG